MSGSSSLLRSSAVMAAGTAVSRILGFARSLVLIAALGLTSMAANMFDTANKIPNILYMLLAGGVLNAVLVPQIVRAAKAPDEGRTYVNRLVTLSITALLVATVLLTLAAPWLVTLYSASVSPQWRAVGIGFAFWCIPQVFFYGLYTVLGQILNAKERFAGYMWAPALNNVVAIAGLGVFIALYGTGSRGEHDLASWDATKIAVVGGLATLGVAVQALVLVFPLRAVGFKWRPVWGVRGVGLGSAGRVAGWTFAAAVVGQVGLVVTTNVANRASELSSGTAMAAGTPGSATYTNALLLFMLPHSLVAVSLVTALFTRMSGNAGSNDWPAVRADLSLGLRTVGVFSVLATVGLIVLAQPVGVAMTGGDPASGGALGRVVIAMALGLTGFSATYLVQRVFYAYEDARTPFLVAVPQQVIVIACDLLAAVLLPPEQMVVGVAAGLSLANTFAAFASAWLLRRRHGGIDAARVIRTHVRLGLIGLVTGAVGWTVVSVLPWRGGGVGWALLCCLIGGLTVVAVFLLGLRLLRVDELGRFVGGRSGRLGALLGRR